MLLLGSGLLIFAMNTQRLSVNDLPLIYYSLFAIYIFTAQPKLRINISWVSSLILITTIAVAASSVSPHQTQSFARLSIYTNLFLLSFSIYLLFQEQLIDGFEAILVAIIVVFLIVTPSTLIEYFKFSADPTKDHAKYISPDLSYYSHIRHYSYQAFIASSCVTILLLNTKKHKALYAIVTAICFAALVASTGRAAILSYLIFVFLCVYLTLGFIRALKISTLFIVLGAVGLTLIHISPYASLTESLILRTTSGFDMNSLLSGRLSFWHGALVSVMDNPLLGLGPDGFRHSEGVIPNTIQPHSSLIQLVVEYGWFGGAIILYRAWLFVAPQCRNLTSDSLNSRKRTCLVAFLIAYFIYSLLDGLFYHVLPMLHLAILMPLVFAFWKDSDKQL